MDDPELKLEVVILNNSFTTMSMRLLGQEEQLIISSSSDLLTLFKGLSSLYVKPTLTLSSHSLLALLVTAEESPAHMCGTVLPISVLSKWCSKLIAMESLKRVLMVSSCYYDLKVLAQRPRSSAWLSPPGGSLEVPSSSLWSLLLWGEALGLSLLYLQCKAKLLRILLESRHTLPAHLLKEEGAAERGEIGERVLAHLLQYPPNKQERKEEKSPVSVANFPTPPPVFSPPVSSHSAPPAPLTSTPPLYPSLYPPSSTPSLSSGSAPSLPLSSSSSTPQLYPPASTGGEEGEERWSTDEEGGEEEEGGGERVEQGGEERERAFTSPRSLLPPSLSPPTSSLPLPQPSSSPVGERRERVRERSRSLESRDLARWNSSPHPTRSASPAPFRGKRSSERGRAEEGQERERGRRSLSAEELKMSRELSLLRIRELKIERDLSLSKLQAERALRNNSLASLQLKTEILRLSSSGRREEGRREQGRRRWEEEAEREREREKEEREREGVERARRRVEEKRRRDEEKKRKEEREREEERRKKWEKRDKRIVEYMKRQTLSPTPPTPSLLPSSHSLLLPPPTYPPSIPPTPLSSSAKKREGRNGPPPPSPSLLPSSSSLLPHSSPSPYPSSSSCPPALPPLLYSQEALAAVGLGLSPSSPLSYSPYPPYPTPSACAPAPPLLQGELHRAWGLREGLGACRPYAVLSLGRERRVTPVTRGEGGDSSPLFSFPFEFEEWEGEGRGGRLTVSLLNARDSLSDELLGYVEIEQGERGDGAGEGGDGERGVFFLTDPQGGSSGCVELSLSWGAVEREGLEY